MQRKCRLNRKFGVISTQPMLAEALEARQLLSASAAGLIAYPVNETPQAGGALPAVWTEHPGSTSPSGYTVAQIESAYGISNIQFSGVTGTGAGQTIAIIAAYGNTQLVDSTSSAFDSSDLHQFDLAEGLPDPPSFTKVNQNGQSATPPASDNGWANEQALDVEWTHAIAPDANILLVEADSAQISDLIDAAVQYVVNVPSVSVVTMSFALNEFSDETSDDSFLQTPAGHIGITFVAASGDLGDIVQYPAASPNVVSVGATTLTLSGSNYSGETGLNTSGGGVSRYETKPSYQFGLTQSSSLRETPDVAMDGDKATGLDVYDSFDGAPGTPWYKVGGTSASAPMWAGLMAITDQGRASLGLGTLDGASQTLPRLYAISSSDYHDVTSGSNGHSAGPGYDLVTGLGSPIANLLVPDLAGGNNVSGTIFDDTNQNGVKNTGENGLSGYSAFVDLYGSGVEQGADPVTTSTSNGSYEFSDLPGGTYQISQPTPAGVFLTTAASHTITVTYDSTVTGPNIGYKGTGAAAQVVFNQQPTNVDAGSDITPPITVDVEDADGHIINTDTSAVTLTSGGGTSLGGTLTVNAVAGVATFSNITVASTGTELLIASDGALTSATSNSFTVAPESTTPGAASQLVFQQQPSPVTVGLAIAPAIAIEIEDAAGRLVTSDTSAVTLTIASGPNGAILGGTTTINAVDGIATFNDISVSATGAVVLTAGDGSLASTTSTSFAVSPAPVGAAAQLQFSQQPSSATVGSVIFPAITVHVLDANGNLVTTDTSAVTLTLASSSVTATLGGTTTVNAVNGVATFSNITLSAQGTFTLTASDGALTAVTSSSFSINGVTLVPTQLSFAQQPTNVVVDTLLNPSIVVSVEDSSGDLVTTNGSPVTLSITSGPAGAILGGTLTESAVDGIAIFSDITLSATGNYMLKASDGALTAAPSDAFSVFIPGIVVPTIAVSHLPTAVVGGAKLNRPVVVKETTADITKTAGKVTTEIYASGNGALVLLGSITRSPGLQPNKTYMVSVPIKSIPASLDGTYSLLATVIDPKGGSATSSAGSSLTVAAPFVSLSETFSKLTLPALVVAGSKTKIATAVKVSNAGNVVSDGSTTVAVYASPDGMQSDATLIASLDRTIKIQPGGSATVSVPFKEFPIGLNGDYTILVQVTDPSSDITGDSSDKTINIAPPTISVQATALVIAPSSVTPGKTATLSITLTNTGNVATSGIADISIGLSTDGVSQQVQAASLTPVVIIPAGKTKTLHLKFVMPATVSAGTYFPVFTYNQNTDTLQIFGTSSIQV